MMMMSEKDSQELLWATTNFGLLMRMELKMKKNTGNTVTSKSSFEQKKFNDKEILAKRLELRRDNAAISDADAKHFMINSVLYDFRQNKAKNLIWSQTLDQIIRRFCNDDFKNISLASVYNYLMELLDTKPPISTEDRWFWICVIASKYGPSYDDDANMPILGTFSKETLQFFKKDHKTLEYKQFLLTLLEYDYAAILARTRSNGINNQLHKFTKISTRGMNFGTMEDLDNIPLAYLLLCKFVTGTRTIQELEPEYLNKLIIGELLMNFDPVADSREFCRIYARLIGLLLDVKFFVDKQGAPYIDDVENDIGKELQNIVMKIWKQHDNQGKPYNSKTKIMKNCNNDEWETFVMLSGIPWAGKLVDTMLAKSSNKNTTPAKTPLKKQISR